MIASIATAVLPVWRSPMISSRWPRPIGTIESIDFRPVCIGWSTDLRAITPGATFSITSVILALIGPLPSIGSPSELTTRPMSSGPTGTARMRPVHLTVSPSVMCSYSPSTTDPTESRSRFNASPKVFPGNSSISPCIASERPWIRQMPSVIDTTVPCVRTCAPVSRFWIFDRMSSLISEGLSCMGSSLPWPAPREQCRRPLGCSAAQLCAHCVELRLDGAVDHRVADRYACAADQLRIYGDRCFDFLAEAPFERGRELGGLLGRQRQCAFDRRLRDVFRIVLEQIEQRANLRQKLDAIRFDQHAQKIAA